MTDREAVIVVAGGTGGHVFPALAVAKELDARGFNPVWMGTHAGLEAKVVPDAGLRIEWINIGGIRGKGLGSLLLAPARILRALWQAILILRRHKPVFMIGMGGFVAGPGGIAAWLTRCPLFIHEQNAIAGLTNRILAKFARRVMIAFPESFGDRCTTLLTGNPLREEFTGIASPTQRQEKTENVLRVLVLGGSQGAMALNQIVPSALDLVNAQTELRVRHQCGAAHLDAVRNSYAATQISVEIVPFMDRMAEELSHTDIVICRAGAMTIAEVSAVGVAAIFIPFPQAVDDHQSRNAEYLVHAKAARMIPEKDLNAELLAKEVFELTNDIELRLRMAEAAHALGRPNATTLVVEECLRSIGRVPS